MFLLFALTLSLSLLLQTTAPDNPNDIGPIIALIVARSLQLMVIVKVMVDVVARAWAGIAGRWLILAACVVGVALDFALLAIGSAPFTRQSVVMAIVAGILAGGGSKAVTDIHQATQPEK